MTISIRSRSITSMIFPATSLSTSTLELAMIPWWRETSGSRLRDGVRPERRYCFAVLAIDGVLHRNGNQARLASNHHYILAASRSSSVTRVFSISSVGIVAMDSIRNRSTMRDAPEDIPIDWVSQDAPKPLDPHCRLPIDRAPLHRRSMM